MKTQLTLLAAQLDEQIRTIENAIREDYARARSDYLPSWKNDFGIDNVNIYAWRLADGSYPLIPLLTAKAQVLSALTMLEINDSTIVLQPEDPLRS